QSGLDRFVGGPRAPKRLLRAEVEDPRPVVALPEEAVARVELARLGFAAAAVLLVHLGGALAKALGNAGAHRALAGARMGEGLDLEGVAEQVAGDEANRHRESSPGKLGREFTRVG